MACTSTIFGPCRLIAGIFYFPARIKILISLYRVGESVVPQLLELLARLSHHFRLGGNRELRCETPEPLADFFDKFLYRVDELLRESLVLAVHFRDELPNGAAAAHSLLAGAGYYLLQRAVHRKLRLVILFVVRAPSLYQLVNVVPVPRQIVLHERAELIVSRGSVDTEGVRNLVRQIRHERRVSNVVYMVDSRVYIYVDSLGVLALLEQINAVRPSDYSFSVGLVLDDVNIYPRVFRDKLRKSERRAGLLVTLLLRLSVFRLAPKLL